MALRPVPVPLAPLASVDRDAARQVRNDDRIRGKGEAGEPVALARRIAATLNAEDRPEKLSPGFFWATGVTTDGHILVSNCYGLGFVPAGQKLPREVRLVTVDDSLPVAERASWASWPWRALAGWARAHGVGLLTVIGTEEQLLEVDIDSSPTVLADDDILPTSEMVGFDRLELIAPVHAKLLAATADERLMTLLPPPLAYDGAPVDRSKDLWAAVGAHTIANGPGREIAQLEALLAFADHSEELAICRAYTVSDPVAQRTAIADGLYWHYLAQLTHDALDSG